MEEYPLTELQETSEQEPIKSEDKKTRDYTDVLFIYLFAFIFSTWLGLVSYVFISGRGWLFLNEKSDDMEEIERKSMNYPIIEFLSAIAREPFHGYYHKRTSPIYIIGGLYAAIAFMLNCFIIARYYPRFSTWVGSICLFGVIIKSICEIKLERSLTVNPETFAYPFYNAVDSTLMRYTVYITKMIFCTGGLVCLKKAGITTVVGILSGVINALFFFAYLTIFGLVILTLEIVIVFCSIVSFYSFSEYTFILYFILFEGIYLSTFIFLYAKIVISPTVASWYLSNNKSSISYIMVFENIITVSRHHFGTISLASIPMVPFIIGSFVACKHTFDKNRSIFNRILDSILLVYLTWNHIDYSLIATSMFGKNLYESTKKSFTLLLKDSSLSLACAYVFYAFTLTGAYLTAFAGAIPSLIWTHDKPYVPSIYALVLTVPVFLLLDLFVQIYVLCCLADDEEEDEHDNLQDNESQISNVNAT